MCVCPEGYRKIGYSDDCEDIDECTTNSELCGQGRCINIEGGYQCECPIGYEISANGKDCTDRRDGFCHQKLFGGRCPRQLPEIGIALVTKADCCCTMGAAWGDECEICPTRGTLAFEKLCMETGFGVYGQDIDECQTLPNLCNNGQCINAMGSYRCICDRGFKPDSTKTACNDVNECLQRPGPCEHECQNTYGSFICSCPPGYLLNSDRTTCRDVDECSTGQHMCEHECVNTQGSYQCVCPPGFTQFGDRCLDTDECVEQPVSTPNFSINWVGRVRLMGLICRVFAHHQALARTPVGVLNVSVLEVIVWMEVGLFALTPMNAMRILRDVTRQNAEIIWGLISITSPMSEIKCGNFSFNLFTLVDADVQTDSLFILISTSARTRMSVHLETILVAMLDVKILSEVMHVHAPPATSTISSYWFAYKPPWDVLKQLVLLDVTLLVATGLAVDAQEDIRVLEILIA